MAKREVEMTVLRNGRREDRRNVVADTSDIPALERMLADWLAAKGWHQDRWPEFTARWMRAWGCDEVRAD